MKKFLGTAIVAVALAALCAGTPSGRHFISNIPPGIAYREFRREKASKQLAAAWAAAQSCAEDTDCMVVPRIGQCSEGRKVAVNAIADVSRLRELERKMRSYDDPYSDHICPAPDYRTGARAVCIRAACQVAYDQED